jgi:hypothetical protein
VAEQPVHAARARGATVVTKVGGRRASDDVRGGRPAVGHRGLPGSRVSPASIRAVLFGIPVEQAPRTPCRIRDPIQEGRIRRVKQVALPVTRWTGTPRIRTPRVHGGRRIFITTIATANSLPRDEECHRLATSTVLGVGLVLSERRTATMMRGFALATTSHSYTRPPPARKHWRRHKHSEVHRVVKYRFTAKTSGIGLPTAYWALQRAPLAGAHVGPRPARPDQLLFQCSATMSAACSSHCA